MTYIGHSLGTTNMFVSLANESMSLNSTNVTTDVADSLNLFIAMAPLARLENMKASRIIHMMAKHSHLIEFWADWYHVEDFYGIWWSEWSKFVCGLDDNLCLWLETFLWATTNEFEDPDRFQVYMGHSWKGVSMKMMYHLAQMVRTGRFEKYDYGKMNMHYYGQEEAPEIKLSEVQQLDVPIAMFYAEHDAFSTVDDVEWLRDELGDSVVHYDSIRGGHLTFLCGEDMEYLEDLIEVIKQYNPPTHEPIAADGGDAVEEQIEAAVHLYDEIDYPID